MATSDISDMLAKVDMETYLDRESVDYRKSHGTRGLQLNLRTCPFCGGSEFKVFMNAESGLGNCFHGSCSQKTFNKFSFIKGHTKLAGKPLIDHLELFAAQMGWIPIKKYSTQVKLSTATLKMPASVALPYNGNNLAYLTNRGITSDIVKYFNLRFSLNGWFKYYLEGEEKFMSFANRVIIPVFDINGVLASFQGRDITGQADRKYLFPPGFAATGAHVYNAHNYSGEDTAIVGEGAFDIFAIKLALDAEQNMRNMIPLGTFGKSISPEQVSVFQALKEKGLKKIIFMWDSEVAAIDDAIKHGNALKSMCGLEVSIALLPKGKDPNEVSGSVVRNAIWRATPLTATSAIKLRMTARA